MLGIALPSRNGYISPQSCLSALRFYALDLGLGQTTKRGEEMSHQSHLYVSCQGHPAELESSSSSVAPGPALLTNELFSVSYHTPAKYSGGFITQGKQVIFQASKA